AEQRHPGDDVGPPQPLTHARVIGRHRRTRARCGQKRRPDNGRAGAPVAERHQHDTNCHDRQLQQIEPRSITPGTNHGTCRPRSALSTMFDNSRALVIGPTPPGFGEIQAATTAASGEISPTMLPSSSRLTPTSRNTAPGLTICSVTTCWTPAAAITMSAWRTCEARSVVPVWHKVTVAFSLRRVSNKPRGRPTVI